MVLKAPDITKTWKREDAEFSTMYPFSTVSLGVIPYSSPPGLQNRNLVKICDWDGLLGNVSNKKSRAVENPAPTFLNLNFNI